MANQFFWGVGVALILIGFVIALVAMIWLILSSDKSGKMKVKGGGVVIIGPIPIIFGTDKESVKVILILSIALVVLLLVFMMFSNGLFG